LGWEVDWEVLVVEQSKKEVLGYHTLKSAEIAMATIQYHAFYGI